MEYTYSNIDPKYFAHTKKNGDKETLKEHSDKTLSCSLQIMKDYSLENVLDNIIKDIKHQNTDLIKYMFWGSIYFHDFGKMNPFFQKIKMGVENPKRYSDVAKLIKGKEENYTGHSILSVMYYFDYFYKKCGKDKELIQILTNLSYNILRHHSSYLDDFPSSMDLEESFRKYLIIYEHDFNIKEYLKYYKVDRNKEGYWFLSRLNYSILTKSDYISTATYYNNFPYNENILSKDKGEEIHNNFYEKDFKNGDYNYNKDINKQKLNSSFSYVANNDNLNYLRNKMLSEALHNFSLNINKNVFYLECPTGGGKTNISMSIVSKLLYSFDIKTVYYVFPFNRISTQTEEVLVNSLHLENEDISSISFDSYKESDNSEISTYEKDTYDIMNNTFMNYPFLLMSHIRFFNILKSNDKKSIYALSKLANSVVVLDEIQAYSVESWDKIVYLIDKYSKLYNIKFIIMSATLPKIDKLIGDSSNNFVNLITNRDLYFNNPNFKNRVSISNELLKVNDISFEDIYENVLNKSEKYYNKYNHCKTIVEFIYKKDASDFSKTYRSHFENKGYTVLMISATTLDYYSKNIINIIKDSNINKIILISTQCIEAGIDIDMDLGFKDVSILDSEEQLAGRINRNSSKKDNVLYLFNLENKFIYKNDIRFKKILYDNEYLEFLQNKKFGKFYNRVLNQLNSDNEYISEKNLTRYISELKNCNHKKSNDILNIIEDNVNNRRIFIPTNIPKEFIDINTNLYTGDFLRGQDVWDCFNKLYEDKKYIEIKKNNKMFSNFCVNLFLSNKQLDKMGSVLIYDEKMNIYYLNDMSIYCEKDGFDLSRFDDEVSYSFL